MKKCRQKKIKEIINKINVGQKLGHAEDSN